MTRSIVVLGLLLNTATALAQSSVPMHEEPRHRLLLTHQHVRVMDVRLPPGDTSLFHRHAEPALFIALSAAPVDIQLLGEKWNGTLPTADPGQKAGEVSVDTSYLRQPLTHRATNVGTRLFRVFLVANATVSPPVDLRTPSMPGRLEVQNRWFRQSRVRLSTRATPRWYSASSPTIVVQPVAGEATLLLGSGEKHVLSTPGSWGLVPTGSRYQLTSSSAATLVVVEVR